MLASDTPWATVPLCPPKRFRDKDSSTFSWTSPLTGRTRSGEVTLNHTGTSERKRGAGAQSRGAAGLAGSPATEAMHFQPSWNSCFCLKRHPPPLAWQP